MLCMTPGGAANSQIGATSPPPSALHDRLVPNTDRGNNREHHALLMAGLNFTELHSKSEA